MTLLKTEIARDEASASKATSDAQEAAQEARDSRQLAQQKQELGDAMAAKAALASAGTLESRAQLLEQTAAAAKARVEDKKKQLTDASKLAQQVVAAPLCVLLHHV